MNQLNKIFPIFVIAAVLTGSGPSFSQSDDSEPTYSETKTQCEAPSEGMPWHYKAGIGIAGLLVCRNIYYCREGVSLLAIAMSLGITWMLGADMSMVDTKAQ